MPNAKCQMPNAKFDSSKWRTKMPESDNSKMPKSRPASVIVLESLLMGQQVKIKDKVYAMDDTSHEIYFQATQYTDWGQPTEKSEEVWLSAFLDIPGFIWLCDQLTGEELFLISVNRVMQRIGRRTP
jgi:tryptophanyl-tRNA synthetase